MALTSEQPASPPLPDHLNVTAAWSVSRAWTVAYDTDEAGYSSSRKQVLFQVPLPDLVRSQVHEKTHHIHNVTTPIGVYLHEVFTSQAIAVQQIIRELTELGLPVKTPLAHYLRALESRSSTLRIEEVIWHAGELVRAQLVGDFDRVDRLRRAFPVARGLSPQAAAQIVRASLMTTPTPTDEQLGKRRADVLHEIRALRRLHVEEEPRTATRARARSLIGNGGLRALLESTAYASELVAVDSDTFARSYPKIASQGDAPYLRLGALTRAVPHLASATVAEFILTMRAIAELILFAPVFPEFDSGLSDGFGIYGSEDFDVASFEPVERWLKILDLPNLPRITTLRDIGPFWHEVRHMLHLETQYSYYGYASTFGRHGDRARKTFALSLDARKEKPPIFANPYIGVLATDATDLRWGSLIEFDTILTRNGQRLMKYDVQASGDAIVTVMIEAWCHRVMLATLEEPVRIPLVYKPSDIALFVEGASNWLAQTTRRELGPLRFEFRPLAFGQDVADQAH